MSMLGRQVEAANGQAAKETDAEKGNSEALRADIDDVKAVDQRGDG